MHSVGGDLTPGSAFARLRVAAGSAERAGSVFCAEVAELADARGSGPRTRKGVGVRVPSSAPSCQVNTIKSIISTSCKQRNPPESSQSVSLGDKTAF